MKITRRQAISFLFAGLGATVVGVLVTEFISRTVAWLETPSLSETVAIDSLWFIDNAMTHYVSNVGRPEDYIRMIGEHNYAISNTLNSAFRIKDFKLTCYDNKGVHTSSATGSISGIYENFTDLRTDNNRISLPGSRLLLKPSEQIFINVHYNFQMIQNGKEVFLTKKMFDEYRFNKLSKEKAQAYLLALSVGAHLGGDFPLMDCVIQMNTDRGVISSRILKRQLFVGIEVDITKMDNILKEIMKAHGR